MNSVEAFEVRFERLKTEGSSIKKLAIPISENDIDLMVIGRGNLEEVEEMISQTENR